MTTHLKKGEAVDLTKDNERFNVSTSTNLNAIKIEQVVRWIDGGESKGEAEFNLETGKVEKFTVFFTDREIDYQYLVLPNGVTLQIRETQDGIQAIPECDECSRDIPSHQFVYKNKSKYQYCSECAEEYDAVIVNAP